MSDTAEILQQAALWREMGQGVALATVVYSNRVERMKASGAPIDWVRFKGPTITAINAIGIPEKAPHPNSAKLFVDFALSKEGQNLLRGLRRIPARPDVFPDPPTLTEGLNLYPARPEGMIENYNDTVARFNAISEGLSLAPSKHAPLFEKSGNDLTLPQPWCMNGM